MDVKLVARTLDTFERFAAEQRPLPLTELARLMDIPVSSCLALARTLVSRGYMYEVKKRGGYYPTRRLLQLAQAIDAVDPVIDIVHPKLLALRDATGETIVLGKILDLTVVYLDVVDSFKPIRYIARPGDVRPVHANSIGKAILGELALDERHALAARLSFERFTERTPADAIALLEQATRAKRRGWHLNLGESAPELSAVAVAVAMGGELYGVSVVGPTERIERQQELFGGELLQLKHELDAGAGFEPAGLS
jgi:DNA-binding IclR family transcriptional regulator